MVRLLAAVLLAALTTAAPADDSGAPARYSYVLGTDISFVNASGHPSWVSGSGGKLRYDGDSDGLTISHAFADYRFRIADTLDATVVANLYNDDIDDSIDFTQAYLEWRPLTLSPNRYRVKIGGFYPRLSMENRGAAWTSPYTISSSAINTWIGEEIRIFGAELSVSRRLQAFGGGHTVSVHAAAFRDNDPAGGLIAWKGWSLHDRQTRFRDTLPLPPLPQIQPDGFFWRQDPFFIPFQENDDELGFYAGAEWQYQNRFLLRTTIYDNRADPRSVVNRQYAWYTEFSHLGLQATLPGEVGLIAQWMSGETVMGPEIRGAHVVDNAYASYFVLLTRAFDRHRVSIRYDDFEITEADRVPLDENAEDGDAWTLAYRYQFNDTFSVAAEWLQIHSERPAWAYNDLAVSQTETQLQLSVLLRVGNR
ncbi:MAG: hypothetical protein OEV03_05180 [Gammaproteobacteria bacterium]|nr:hypothetical protein [Gammaproteobacteria bacterium]